MSIFTSRVLMGVALFVAAMALGCQSVPSGQEEITHNFSGDAKYRGTSQNGVVVTVYDAPCQFKDVVTNVPFRATWEEKGKVFEGCVMAHPIAGGRAHVFGFWFDDKTLFIELVDAFQPLSAL